MNKAERVTATREAILTAAERPFAEHGVGLIDALAGLWQAPVHPAR
ncbi:hypothetical protein [Lentzea guizhouensis]|nr:hypothetical protein [Lentzea guizhouensis]